MSDAARRLPARPSLEQLRKQAREHLDRLRATDASVRLSDAQQALAVEYGFASWPKLVHHVTSVRAGARIEPFERLADDILAACRGDGEALQRLIAHYGVSYSPEQLRLRVQSNVNDGRGGAPGDLIIDDVRRLVARQYGFATWSALAEGLAQPPDESPDPRLGLSTSPPFYRIDTERNTIEPQPPLSARDWDTIFAVMRERAITGIVTAAITDDAMAKLSMLDFVTSIDLGGAQAPSDDGMRHLARMTQLERLVLGGWHSPLTDRGLAALPHLTRLRVFAIGWAQHVTDAGVAGLAGCDQLETVNLMGTPTGDGALAALRGKRTLRDLRTGRLVTDAGIGHLHDIPSFRQWQENEIELDLMRFAAESGNLLLDGPITDRGIARLAGLDGVSSLGFFWHAKEFTGDGLAALAALPHLVVLGCQDERCDDAAMRSIAGLPKLRKLMAQGTVASDDGFTALSRSPTLEYLWGRECPNLYGRGFAQLADMPALRGIGVSCRQVDDAALATLPRFPALQQLMPMDVPDAGFRHVGACRGLTHLWCMYCRDTGDVATAHIGGLELKTYYAGKTQITDASLEILARMRTLESIELWQTAGITDTGIRALARLPRLRKLTVSGLPGVTRQGVAALPASVLIDYGS